MGRDRLACLGLCFMRKSVFVLAVIAAACSSVAFAAEVKKDKAHVPAVKATTMSDADMDKVTAGFSQNQNPLNGGVPTPGWAKNFIGEHSNGTLAAGGCNRLSC
jgi:hypothetical protein